VIGPAFRAESARLRADFRQAPQAENEYLGMKSKWLKPTDPPDKAPLKSPGACDQSDATLWERLHYALGPVAGCLVLDLVDFATLGPIGLAIGIPVGAAIGWWLGSLYGFKAQGRTLLAALCGLYCTIPFTEVLPIATVIGATARFYHPPPAGPPRTTRE
jgi:hypothetical protein